VTVGEPGDPTDDATIAWPADRRQVDAGTIVIDTVAGEDAGSCTDINFDPLVLPAGIEPSDDPLLSARSAAYSRSFTLRAGEKGRKPPSAVVPSAATRDAATAGGVSPSAAMRDAATAGGVSPSAGTPGAATGAATPGGVSPSAGTPDAATGAATAGGVSPSAAMPDAATGAGPGGSP